MRKIRRRYVLLAYSYDGALSKDVLRDILRNAYLSIPKRPNNFNNLFLPLQKGYVIFSVPHSLVDQFKYAAKEEFSKNGSKCEAILVSGTLRVLKEKAKTRLAARG